MLGQVKLEAAWEIMPSMQDVFLQQVQEEDTNQKLEA
jgi:hypothetical protein